MDNQHKLIAGYRDLSANEVASMNEMKELERIVGFCLDKIRGELPPLLEDRAPRGRWLALARTHLETGFMFAIKAVDLPTNGLGRFDL